MLVADSSVQLKVHHCASFHLYTNNRITFTDSNCPKHKRLQEEVKGFSSLIDCGRLSGPGDRFHGPEYPGGVTTVEIRWVSVPDWMLKSILNISLSTNLVLLDSYFLIYLSKWAQV